MKTHSKEAGKNTLVGVLGVVELSFVALEELAPTLVLSNFLLTDAVNLFISLMGMKLSDTRSDLAFDLFLSAELNAGAMDLTGVDVNLEVPITCSNLKEETGTLLLPFDSKISCSELEPCCNNYFCISAMYLKIKG